MKNISRCWISIILVAFVIMFSGSVSAETAGVYEKEEWKESHVRVSLEAGITKAIYVDAAIYTMDTRTLIMHILENPHIIIFYYADSSVEREQWYDSVREEYDILIELEAREDAVPSMIQIIQEYSEEETVTTPIAILKSILLSDYFLNRAAKEGYTTSWATNDNETTIQEKYAGDEILPQAAVSVPVVSMNTPINLVYVGFFETLDECRVDYYRPDGVYSVADYEVLDEMICDMIPGIQLVRNGTHRYNCHSYAWYSQSGANDRWIKYPTGYLNDIHCERISHN